MGATSLPLAARVTRSAKVDENLDHLDRLHEAIDTPARS
jgi:hypothetical protein